MGAIGAVSALALTLFGFGGTHEHAPGERVVITGASSGIGEQIAYVHCALGARVVIAARRKSDLERVAAKCTEMGASSAKVVVADFANADAVATP